MIAAQPHLSLLKYRPDIDGLRALAVGAVVSFHIFPEEVSGGFIGVDIFFVISGYLISTIIFEKLDRDAFSFFDFYSRRIYRIFPALIFVLVACLAFGWIALLTDEFTHLGKHIAAGAGFVSNFLLLNETGYFDISAKSKPLLHLWSLGIEEQFYIFLPLLLYFSYRYKLNILRIIIFITITSFLLNMIGIRKDVVATFYSPLTRFWELLCGSILAWTMLDRKIYFSSIYQNIFSISGLLLLIYGIFFLNKESNFPGALALIPVLGTLLILIAGSSAKVNAKLFSNKVIVYIGLISYPLYLWHWPVLSFSRIATIGESSTTTKIGIVLISFVLAYLTYKFIEYPIRHGIHKRIKFIVLNLLMILIGLMGYSIYKVPSYIELNSSISSAIFKSDAYKSAPNNQITTLETDAIAEINEQQLSYTFPQTIECRANHVYATATCYESVQKYDESVLLIGDSHMDAITFGFKKLFDQNILKMNVLAIGKAGCNPFLNTESVTFENTSYGCNDVITPAINEAIKQIDIKWVILVGRHAARYNGTGFGQIELESSSKPWTYEYTAKQNKSRNNSEAFIFGLEETINEIVKAGKRVIVIHQMPELGFDPRRCLRKFNNIKSKNCELDISIVNNRMRPYKTAVNDLLISNVNVFQYDPKSFVCNSTQCSPFNKDGYLFYRDDDHMSMIGSEFIAKDIFEKILSKH